MSSMTEELERLAALHEKGALTGEEFEEAKARVLAEDAPPTKTSAGWAWLAGLAAAGAMWVPTTLLSGPVVWKVLGPLGSAAEPAALVVLALKIALPIGAFGAAYRWVRRRDSGVVEQAQPERDRSLRQDAPRPVHPVGDRQYTLPFPYPLAVTVVFFGLLVVPAVMVDSCRPRAVEPENPALHRPPPAPPLP